MILTECFILVAALVDAGVEGMTEHYPKELPPVAEDTFLEHPLYEPCMGMKQVAMGTMHEILISLPKAPCELKTLF